jgi:UDP-glucose:(heptosyl)LPS alpha-1,3-glucosyltransferase
MRIALIRRRFSPHGGAERYVMNLGRRLAGLGHEVHIFSHFWPADRNFQVHLVPLITGWGAWELVSFNGTVNRLIKRNRFDVVQSFEKTTCQDVYRAGEGCHREWLRQRRRYEPFYRTVAMALNPFHWTTLSMERRLYERSQTRFFIANSQRGKNEILSHYQVDPEKITVLYNAVPSDLSLPPGPAARSIEADRTGGRGGNQKTILFVGSGFRRKGLYFLIKALPLILREADVRLLAVGQGNRKKASGLASRLGVAGRLELTGPVADAAPYFGRADAFVLPSIYEPFSNACLEAMAFGLPIVTTEMNGASEAIVAGENGFIVRDPSRTELLAESVLKALALERKGVERRHQTWLGLHTWDHHLDGLMQIYRRITAAKTT